MFSNQTFLHLVIADEKDLYYTEDMLRLNLNQHIWLQAHKAGWKKVYFLTAEAKDRTFSIRTFGDRDAESFQPKGGLFKKKQSLGDWMLDKLKSPKESTAFVCSLQDFCTVMEGSAWEDTLLRMIALSAENRQKGILILTASVYADDLRDLLMQSPVFEKKKIGRFNNKNPNAEASLCPAVNTLRASDAPIPLYETLSHEMQSSIYFLSSFTSSRISIMLDHMFLKKANRIPQTPDETNELCRFLTDYLNSSCVRGEYLISSDTLGNCPGTFRDLARWLEDDRIWSRVRQKATSYQKELRHVVKPPLGYYRHGTLGDTCATLQLRTDDAELSAILSSIRRELKSPRQLCENPSVAENIRLSVNTLSAGADDPATLRRCATLILYGIRNLYCREDSEENAQITSTLNVLQSMVVASRTLHRDKVEYRQLKSLHNATSDTMQNNLLLRIRAQEEALDQADMLISKALSYSSGSKSYGNINNLIDDMRNVLLKQDCPPTDPQPVIQPSPVDDTLDLLSPEEWDRLAELKT